MEGVDSICKDTTDAFKLLWRVKFDVLFSEKVDKLVERDFLFVVLLDHFCDPYSKFNIRLSLRFT